MRKEWRKKEEERQAWHDSCNQKSKELGKIHEEKEKEVEPLVKGKDTVKEKEPLVKGTTIAGKEPLENLKNEGAAAPAASAAAPAASAAATAASAAAPAAPAAPAGKN